MTDVLISLYLTWMFVVAAHFAWEIWIILTRGRLLLPRCRRWWCPEGWMNRWKDIR